MNRFKSIISGVLAILMFAMIFIPCADDCNSAEHTIPTTVQQAQDHHQHENDICSPFCVCACCSTNMTVGQFHDFKIALSDEHAEYLIFYQSFVSAFSNNIWQPPKIS